MNKKKNTAILLWVIALIFFITSFTFIKTNETEALITGMIISVVLAVIGYLQFKKYKNLKTDNTVVKNSVPYLKDNKPVSNIPKMPDQQKEPEINASKHIEVPDAFSNYQRKCSYDDVLVAYNTEFAASVPLGEYVEIRPEPDNQYDDKALALYYMRNKIGYLPANRLQEMYYAFINRNGSVKARAASFSGDRLLVAIAYFDKIKPFEVDKSVNHKVFTLSGSGSEEKQGNLSVCENGNEVTLSWNAESGKLDVNLDNLDIGYLPKAAEEYVSTLSDFKAFIQEVYEDENDKYKAKIVIMETEQK